jgi:NADH dehydrogenase/NADH:ubiquinone oxidoreductase subunit G
VLCGRCIWVCQERLGIAVLGFAYRGFERVVTTFEGKPLAATRCVGCADCVEVCPTGALSLKEESSRQAGHTS